jgi:hypothetical protein
MSAALVKLVSSFHLAERAEVLEEKSEVVER